MQSDVNLIPPSSNIIFGIDASSANKDERTGVEQYAFELIEAMKQEPLQSGESVFLYAPTPLVEPLSVLPTGWQARVLSWRLKRGWMQGRVSWELLRRPPSVLFVPAQALPILSFSTRLLTTVHDIGFHDIASKYDPAVRKRVAFATKRAIKHASRILTVSAFTKESLRKTFHIPEEKMVVTPLAANFTTFRRLNTQTIEPVLRELRIGQTFFLFVGRLEKKKNVTTLIRAFELFKQTRGIGDPFELVLVGSPGYGYEEIKKYIQLSAQKGYIRETGYIKDASVAALMNQAMALVFPSWYEGFGIPVLEAMACGTAVIASDIPALRGVAADAAVFVDPNAPEQWAKQMTYLAEHIESRDALIGKGTLRVSAFSWSQTAKQTWAVLRSLV